jgi:hypothetical protein
VLADHGLELLLGDDRDAVGIKLPGERGRIDAAVDVRNLCRREGDDLVLRAVPIDDVEVVEVAAGCAGDDDTGLVDA